MPDPKQDDDDDQAGDPNARWGAEAAGVEPIGAATETEDLTPEDRRAGNAKAAEIRQRALERARQLADEGEGDDESDEGDARKD